MKQRRRRRPHPGKRGSSNIKSCGLLLPITFLSLFREIRRLVLIPFLLYTGSILLVLYVPLTTYSGIRHIASLYLTRAMWWNIMSVLLHLMESLWGGNPSDLVTLGRMSGSADPVQGVSCLAATRTILAFVCVLSACYSPLCPSLAPLWYICSVKCRLQPYSTENQHEQCLFLPNIKSLIMFRYGSGCRFSLLKLERVLL